MGCLQNWKAEGFISAGLDGFPLFFFAFFCWFCFAAPCGLPPSPHSPLLSRRPAGCGGPGEVVGDQPQPRFWGLERSWRGDSSPVATTSGVHAIQHCWFFYHLLSPPTFFSCWKWRLKQPQIRMYPLLIRQVLHILHPISPKKTDPFKNGLEAK